MSRHDDEAESSQWRSRSLTVMEVEELARVGLMVPPDMHLPKG